MVSRRGWWWWRVRLLLVLIPWLVVDLCDLRDDLEDAAAFLVVPIQQINDTKKKIKRRRISGTKMAKAMMERVLLESSGTPGLRECCRVANGWLMRAGSAS